MKNSHSVFVDELTRALRKYEATGDHDHQGGVFPGDCVACAVRPVVNLPVAPKVAASEEQLPILHLNGSGTENLEKLWHDVYEASGALIEALTAAYPHGRDYYVSQDPNALKQATEEHHGRVEPILDTQKFAGKVLLMLADARSARDARLRKT